VAKIIPSPLCYSFEELQNYIRLSDGLVERFQIDVVDGVFAARQSILPPFNFTTKVKSKLDYHLMVKSPIEWVDSCMDSGADRIIGHVEMMASQGEFASYVAQKGAKPCLAIDLNTPIDVLEKSVLGQIDMILVLCVKAGMGGQKFEDSVFGKIEKLSKLREENGYKFKIGVDGGVTEDKLLKLSSLGVSEFCIGKRIFDGSFQENLLSMQNSLKSLELSLMKNPDPEIAFYMERPVFKHVAFFGDADVLPESDVYQDAFEVAKIVASNGLTIVNGGGPGVMDASTKGAEAGHGETLSVTFYPKNAPGFEGRYVGNVTDTEIKTTNYIERMFKLMEHADIFIIFKGGTGTISEFGTAWVLAKLYYGHHKPFILFGEFWEPIIEAISKNLLIDSKEMDVFEIVKRREDIIPTIHRMEEKLKNAFALTKSN